MNWSPRTAVAGDPNANTSWRTPAVFDGGRYFDVFIEYAKGGPDDVIIQVTVANRGDRTAPLHLLPTLWFRNTWSWGRQGEGYGARPQLAALDAESIAARPRRPGRLRAAGPAPRALAVHRERDQPPASVRRCRTQSPFVKDAFHDFVVQGREDRVNPAGTGTKAAALYRRLIPAGAQTVIRLRLTSEGPADLDGDFDQVLALRRQEADQFYQARCPALCEPGREDDRRIVRQGYAGLLWSKQFYHYDVRAWLQGDPAQPAPPPDRGRPGSRNLEWLHLYNRDVLSMPDKWEYPWYAAWDLAFHMIPFARIDPAFAKQQLLLLLREWYMHPNGQLPAYEFALRRREPAGARLGRPGGSTRSPSARTGSATGIFWPGCSRSCCSTSPGGSTARTPTARTSSRAAFSAWTTSGCSIARSRCPPGARWNRRTAPPGWRSTAPPCCRWPWNWPGGSRPTRTWPRSSSSTSSASPTPSTPWAAAACGTRATASTTTSCTPAGGRCRCGCDRWSACCR